MRPVDLRHQLLSRPLLALLAAVVVLGAAPALASASSVQITPVKGAPVTLNLDQMPTPPDVNGQVYTLRSDSGERQVTVSGYSLAALIDAAGLDPILIGYLEIPRPAGGSLLLSRQQATMPGVFPEGLPVVFRDDQGIHLLRPSAGGTDFNEADLISLPTGSTLAIQARSGTLVQIRASASKRKVKVGEEVSFTATLDRAASGEDVEISWYFDDGSSAKGSETKHRFRQPGLYDVVVGATTASDRVGASATVTVRVGEPVKQGPKRRGGGTNREKNAPDSGASQGASGSNGGPGPSSAPSPGYSPAPSYTSPPPDPGYSPPTPAPQPQPQPKPEKKQPVAPEPKGDQIAGELLAATDILDKPLTATEAETSNSAEKPPVAARTGSADPVQGGGGISGAALGIGAALAMFGLGGLLEARGIGRLRW